LKGIKLSFAMGPVLDAWAQMIVAVRGESVPMLYTTPDSGSDGADVVMLPTRLSAETGVWSAAARRRGAETSHGRSGYSPSHPAQ
jgi:hypothetical protein